MLKERKEIVLPLEVEHDGRNWTLYVYEYDSDDGLFGGYLYALSDEHAEMILMELKESARILGPLESVIE